MNPAILPSIQDSLPTLYSLHLAFSRSSVPSSIHSHNTEHFELLSAQSILTSTIPTQLGAMSSHQGLPSPLASLEHGGSLIHTVNTAPLSLLLGSLNPLPLTSPFPQAPNDWPCLLTDVYSINGSRTYSQSTRQTRHRVLPGMSCAPDSSLALVTHYASRSGAGERERVGVA